MEGETNKTNQGSNSESSGPVLADLRSIVGEEHVLVQGDRFDVERSVAIPFDSQPLCVVFPEDREDVRSILQCAQKHARKVWPTSRGLNWGYGSASAATNGSILLSLRRMDVILEVNEELGFARIQPGVSYRALSEHLQRNGSSFALDVTDGPADGSVIGNALDRGLGMGEYFDHFGSICGMEVVLADGKVIRTGSGSLETCQTWNTYKWGLGPDASGLFAQSNLGVVTEAGIWLHPQPESLLAYFLNVHDPEKVPALLDTIGSLSREGILQGFRMPNEIVQLCARTQLKTEYPSIGNRALSEEERNELCSRYRIQPCLVVGPIYGRAAEVRVRKKIISKALAPYGSLRFASEAGAKASKFLIGAWQKAGRIEYAWKSIRKLGLPMPREFVYLPIFRGVPTDQLMTHAYFRMGEKKPKEGAHVPRDEVGLLWFAPTVPLRGSAYSELVALTRPIFEKYGFDYYLAVLYQNSRSMVGLSAILFERGNVNREQKALELYNELRAAAAAAGIIEYRLALNGMPDALSGSEEYFGFIRSIKKAVDPNEILAPGRYGI